MKYLFVFILLLASIASGMTRYVSPNGSNTAPYDTWDKAANHPNTMNGVVVTGDTVLIAPRRILGVVVPYDSTYIVPPRGGTLETVYGCSVITRQSAIDTLRSMTRLSSGYQLTGTWSPWNGSSTIYKFSAPFRKRWNAYVDYSIVVVQDDNQMWHSVPNIGGAGSPADCDQPGEFLYDDSLTDGGHDSIYAYPYGGGDPDSYDIRVSGSVVVFIDSTNQDRISFIGLSLEMGHHSVVVLSNSSGARDKADSIRILSCNVKFATDRGAANNTGLIYFGYDSGSPPTSANEHPRFCVVDRCSLDYAWSPDDDLSGGSGIEMYCGDNTTITNNWFGPNLRAAAISMKFGGGAGNNTHADSNVIAYNFISYGSKVGIWTGPRQSNLWIYGNYISGIYRGLDIHSTGSKVPYYGPIHVLNNTIYNPGGSDGACVGIYTIAGGSGNEYKYNIIQDNSSPPRTIEFFDIGSEGGSQTPPVETYWTANYNMYYAGTFSCRFSSNSSCSGTNWSAWNTCGFDVNGSTGVDPGFANYAGLDFSRPSSSAEINVTYGGKTWTRLGAWQPSGPCPDTIVAPVFVTPSDGTTGLLNQVILDWSDSTQVGTIATYDLQVDDNSDFSSITFSSNTPWSRDTVTTNLKPFKTYFWRLRGYSSNACDTSDWSGYRSFTMGDSCIRITGKVSLPTANTCYCVLDTMFYTFANRDTIINTNGKDNIRIYGYNNNGGQNGVIRYSADDAGNLSSNTDTTKGTVVLHIGGGSDNVYVRNLAILPNTIDDSVNQLITMNVLSLKGLTVESCSLVTAGFSSRAFQAVSTGGTASFNMNLYNSAFGTISKGYRRRDALFGATILVGGGAKTDPAFLYTLKIQNCRVQTVHTGIGIIGGSTYPVFYIDTNWVSVDAQNDLFMTYDNNDVNNSAGDPFGINIDGGDSLSRISNNTITSMQATHYGGDGMILQHINATATDMLEVFNNVITLKHGPHPRIDPGRQAAVGVYIRNYAAGYYVSGLHFHDNLMYIVVDTNTSTTEIANIAEGIRMGYDNGSRENLIERNHISIIPTDSLTRTTAGTFEVAGLSFVQRDSLYTGREYTGRGTLARYNYYRVPKTPIWFGETRIGYGANNCRIIGDTCNTLYDGDSTFVRFHQSGTFFDHHAWNSLQDMVLLGFANPNDVVKGMINDTLSGIGWIEYPPEHRQKQGKQLSYLRSLTVNFKDISSANVNGGTIWAIDGYGHRFDMPNSNASGNSSDTLRWQFFGYDYLTGDGYPVADSNSYNGFTFWGKIGSDSASTSATINWTTSQLINVQLNVIPPPPGIKLKGTKVWGTKVD